VTATLAPIAIIGATGPTGRHLAGELRRRGLAVRVVSRSAANLERCFPGPGCARVTADALDRAALGAAVQGCGCGVDCIGLPPDRMDDHARTARVVVDAAREAGARCLQVSSYWADLPPRAPRIDESHPREGGSAYVRARRAAEDVMLAAGAAVVHLPDFFGPHVHASSLQQPLIDAAAGKPMQGLGSADLEREYAYVPDAMRMVADLLARDEAYGRAWIVPGSGPLSLRRAAAIASRHLGRPVAVRAAPAWLAKALSLVSADLRALRPVIDDYAQPIAFDARRLAALLGDLATTPYEEAIPATLDALRREDAASRPTA